MRIQFDGKVYNVKSYDLKKGEFILTNGKREFLVNDTDELLQAYIIIPSQYRELKYGRFTKPKPENKEE